MMEGNQYPEWEVVVTPHFRLGCKDEFEALRTLDHAKIILGYPDAYIVKHWPDHDERYKESH